jgi:hypothetical protein
MKKATATSHGKRRLEAGDGPDKGELTTCEADEIMYGRSAGELSGADDIHHIVEH